MWLRNSTMSFVAAGLLSVGCFAQAAAEYGVAAAKSAGATAAAASELNNATGKLTQGISQKASSAAAAVPRSLNSRPPRQRGTSPTKSVAKPSGSVGSAPAPPNSTLVIQTESGKFILAEGGRLPQEAPAAAPSDQVPRRRVPDKERYPSVVFWSSNQ